MITPIPDLVGIESPAWVLVGSAGLWGAECLTPGCLWVTTGPTPETVDKAAERHAETCYTEGDFIRDDH